MPYDEVPDQSLTGGSIPEQPSFAKEDIPLAINSVLDAILGGGPHHRQMREDLANQRMPESPSFSELFDYMPGMRGQVRPSTALGGKQLKVVNRISDWLNRAGIEYNINLNRSNMSTVYMYTRHPLTNEEIVIRVPRDGHTGYLHAQQSAQRRQFARPGNFYDTAWTFNRTDRPIQSEYLGNVSGGPYHDLDNLFDALRHRYSRSPTDEGGGNWLIPPGREPHYPNSNVRPSDASVMPRVPMTGANEPILWGRTYHRGVPPASLNRKIPKKITLTPRQVQLELPF